MSRIGRNPNMRFGWTKRECLDRRQCAGRPSGAEFTADGRQLLEIGYPTNAPRNNADTSFLGETGGIEVDSAAHEVYISDGYLNNRVVVYDSDNGNFKRGWGDYGIGLGEIANPPEPTGEAASALGRYVREGT